MKKKTPQGLSDKADMLALIDVYIARHSYIYIYIVRRRSAVDFDETK